MSSIDNGWLEAAIAWEVCASLHRQYCKGQDALFTTRQSDFIKHAEAARLKATAAPQQEAQEPVAWHVCSVNSDGSLSLEHAAAWEEAAHEHINDAITDHDIEGAGSWVVRPAYHAPQPSPAAQVDALDAARYRLVRRGQRWSVINGIGNGLRAEELDAAVDAARAAQEGKSHDN